MAPNRSTVREVRWRSRPVLSASVRVAAVLAPAAGAAAVAVAVSHALPVPTDTAGTLTWWALFLITTLVTWVVLAGLLQRLLPLAALLDLTLLFPDTAPSRFAMLRRGANPRQLEAELRRVQQMGPDTEPARRAQVILELAAALSVHDSRTRGHSERVRMFTDLVARQLRLREGDADRLRWAALLHDIGKLAVAPEILNKPGRPEEHEWVTLYRHPLESYRLIAPLHAWLGEWAKTVRDHHEHFDGTGYPSGLRGHAISLGGRIVAVTDSYETMTAARPYKPPMSVRAAREELVRRSGSQFDPDVVRAFLAISLGKLWQAVGLSALVAALPFLAPVSPRLSHLGQRSFSAAAAAGATAMLLVVGLAGPPRSLALYGPSSAALPQMAIQSASPPTGSPPGPPVPSPPGSATPAPSTAPSGAGASPSQASGAAVAAAGSSGSATPLFPAGINKQAQLPSGVAKNPSAFTGWRNHH